MSQHVFKMPDLGEGTVEAEIVRWHVKPGDRVKEDQVVVEVMTDKAAVEVPAPVSGRIASIGGEPGDKIAVGAPLIVFDVGDDAAKPQPASPAPGAAPAAVAAGSAGASPLGAGRPGEGRPDAGRRIMTSPANRRRAREAGIELASLAGTGPGGRILRADVEAAAPGVTAPGSSALPGAAADAGPGAIPAADTTEIKVIGVRRVIAERMSEAKRNIPHFAYIEEVDVTELESLRRFLNADQPKDATPLTYLPLVVMALTRVLESFPQCNALYDATRGVLIRHRAVHVGIATQTPEGLKVPVVRNAQSLQLHELAAEIRRLSELARSNRATREQLLGSTITVTSLGRLGGIASTPVINSPEVAIVGLNKALERPVVLDGAVVVRRIMNLSSSFDHRFVDGYDGAAMIQALKERLEHPATIFIPKARSA
jgi:2-oxoisovalerate dehydrogenase E2 component (dihydrolipoyl transacylase)